MIWLLLNCLLFNLLFLICLLYTWLFLNWLLLNRNFLNINLIYLLFLFSFLSLHRNLLKNIFLNNINISIDKITDSLVVGHSVVAGNDRPFEGKVKKVKNQNHYIFKVKEPGDNKYDGEFTFEIEDNQLSGTWIAYKNIEIKKRKYLLNPKKIQNMRKKAARITYHYTRKKCDEGTTFVNRLCWMLW